MPERRDIGVTVLFILLVITIGLIYFSDGMDSILIIMLMNWLFILATLMIFVRPVDNKLPPSIREFKETS